MMPRLTYSSLELCRLLREGSLGSVYLEGQGDLVSRVIMEISRVTIWIMEAIDLLTTSP